MFRGKNMGSFFTKVLAITMVLAIMASNTAISAFAASIVVPEDTYVVSNNTKKIAPGIVESEIITNNKSGNKQNIDYVCEVDLKNTSTTKIIAGYGGYDATSWKMDKLTNQVKSAEKATGLNVVAGINGDFYNMSNGAPNGALVMEGKAYHHANNAPYFAVLKDGSAVIRDGKVSLDDVEAAIGGDSILVKDGKVSPNLDSNYISTRCAVGIKPDGTVVTFTTHGRNYPVSSGRTYQEVAEMLVGLGCETALNLDGGGSATYASQYEGSDEFNIRNNPSDGTERKVSSTLLIVSTAKPTGEFDHASVSPSNTVYTPNSSVEFSAKGVDSAGGSASLPSDIKWELDEKSKELGSINDKGVFTSSGKTGDIKVNLTSGGKVVGTTYITIAKPDSISFSNEEISLGFDKSSNLGIIVKYKGRDVIYKDGDFNWTLSDKRMGTFNGNIFTSSDSETVNGDITATSVYNSSVSGKIHAIIGRLPSIAMDFEDYKNPETGEVTPAKDYWTFTRAAVSGGISQLYDKDGNKIDSTDTKLVTGHYFNGSNPDDKRGGKESAEIVDIASGEPVRFGNNSLKLNYDFSEINGTEGACIGFAEDAKPIEGSPTAIGMWVYAPEGTPNLWLRIRVRDGKGALQTLNFTEQMKDGNLGGINWTGWKYVEADLSHLTGPFTLSAGETIRLMHLNNAEGSNGDFLSDGTRIPKSQCKGSIYIDNLRFVYGANIDDTEAPVVDNLQLNGKDLKDGDMIETNTVSFKSMFHDIENKYTTGIDHDTVYIFVDGQNMTEHPNYVLQKGDNTLYLNDLVLANGTHTVEVLVRDGFGNEATLSRTFTIKGDDKYTNVSLEPKTLENPKLNGNYELELKSNKVKDVKSVSATIQVGSDFNEHDVKFDDNYEGTFEYIKKNNEIKLNATRKDGLSFNSGEGSIATITSKIPRNLKEGSKYSYGVTKGSIEYSTESEDNASGTFSSKMESIEVQGDYTVEADTLIVGESAKVYVKDENGNPVEGATVYYGEDKNIGQTDKNGEVDATELCKEPAKYSIYAEKDGKYSFSTTFHCVSSTGQEDGMPFNIINNATSNSTNSKKVSWFAHPKTSKAKAIMQIAKKEEYDSKGEAAFKECPGTSKIQSFTGSSIAAENGAARINNVVAEGLTPNVKYIYRVGDGEKWSETDTFTLKRKGTDTNLFVIGDIQQQNTSKLDRIVDRLNESGVDYNAGIQVGDLVDKADIYGDWNTTLGSLSKIGSTDFVTVTGNHEHYGDSYADIAENIYSLPDKRHYSAQYGNVYVGVINYTTSRAQLEKDLEWLREDAKKSNATWKILVTHSPPYYTNTAGGNEIINELLPPVADEVGLDFVFSGHDHAYARTKPLNNRKVDEKNGTVYVVAGSAGDKTYAPTDNKDFHFAKLESDYDGLYITASTNGSEFKIEARESNGTLVDSFTKTKNGSCQDGHDYSYEDGYLTCKECGSSKELGTYTGFATVGNTDKKMYFIQGQFQTGWFTYGKDEVYHFGTDGISHNVDSKITEEHNCTQRGEKIVTCAECNISKTYIGAKAPGHDFQRIDLEDGSYKYICSHTEYNCRAEGKYIGDENIKLSYTKTTYNGNKKVPAVTITDKETGEVIDKEHYTISYLDNTNAGTAKVRVKARGNTYADMAYVEYTIRAKSIEDMDVKLSSTEVEFDGQEQKPKVTIDGLESEKDFDAKYSNNIKPGTATITITGKANYTGTIIKEFKIMNPDMSKVTGLTSTERTTSGFKLKWNKINDADGYKVYEYNSNNKSYKLIGTVEGNDNTSYNISSLKDGSTYKYAVRAYKTVNENDYFGPYSTVLTTTTYPNKVTGVTTTNRTTSSMKVKWRKVENCEGYKIYEYNESDKTYAYLKTVSENDNTSYEIKNLKSGTTYKYAIRAYKKIGENIYNGQHSTVLTTATTPLKVKGLTTKNRTSTSITLSWDKVSRAEGYRIYRYNSENKKYELIDQVEENGETTYTDKKLISGKNYYYKVKAYKKIKDNIYLGSYSDSIKTCPRK
ncbi:phosphodiester glycosidase family protein [Terrisporobacter mayombei]|uniref:Fibronectin type-III domain-containing protein n=1 Tax=Terrisporobacter mayombei TaxID=1541 RepID=A0ABY9Q536_9FIRM|nr:phosphodiester glycosidase family protein [Terrisporobacter mayombei]MCC3868755.1 phosphodiester glycosidase family protein [Terrisporobacter mayombei]WMT83118.1 hypothetical protein TEMA_36160 [Terrisporobacter mayombei]